MKKKYFLNIAMGGGIILPIILISCSKEEQKENLLFSNNFLIKSNNNQSIVCFDKRNFENDVNFDNYKVYEQKKEIIIDYSKSYVNGNSIYLFINSQNNKDLTVKNKNLNKSFIITKNKNLKKVILKDDQKYFINLIKNISNNNIPTIIYSYGASLPMQQSFLISLINFYNNIKTSNVDNRIIHIMSNDGFDSKRFNSDVLKEKNIWNGIENIEQINETNNKDLLYLLRDNNINADMLLSKFDISGKYDLVIQENKFFDMKREDLLHLLKNANKVILTYDGNIHTNTIIPKLISNFESIRIKSREENIKFLKDLQSGKSKDLNDEDFYNLMLLDKYEVLNENSDYDFFTFLSADSNLLNTVNLSNDNIWSEYSFSTNFLDYAQCLNDQNDRKSFLDTYSKLFVGSNLNMNDLIINGLNYYDPNKRNAIFLGSSLFRKLSGELSPDNYSRLQTFPNLRQAVQSQMKQLLNKFPEDEYNIIFKLHPSFSSVDDPTNKIAINYVNLITNGLIKNPIIISPSVPLETLIVNDYYIYSNKPANSKLDNFIFRENKQYKAQEWTTFFGLQATTTTIHTTRLFYESTFNISKSESAKLIPFSNFPIPTKFRVVDREDNDIDVSTNYYEANKETIRRIYIPYIPSIYYRNELLDEYDSIVLNWDS